MEQGNSTFTWEIADIICARMCEGETLSEICRDEDMPGRRTVYDWLRQNVEFAKAMDIARDIGADAIADKSKGIMDERPEYIDTEHGKKVDPGFVSWQAKRSEHYLKLLAKWHPGRYGPRLDLNHGGQSGNPLVVIRDLTGRKDEEKQ